MPRKAQLEIIDTIGLAEMLNLRITRAHQIGLEGNDYIKLDPSPETDIDGLKSLLEGVYAKNAIVEKRKRAQKGLFFLFVHFIDGKEHDSQKDNHFMRELQEAGTIQAYSINKGNGIRAWTFSKKNGQLTRKYGSGTRAQIIVYLISDVEKYKKAHPVIPQGKAVLLQEKADGNLILSYRDKEIEVTKGERDLIVALALPELQERGYATRTRIAREVAAMSPEEIAAYLGKKQKLSFRRFYDTVKAVADIQNWPMPPNVRREIQEAG